MGCTVLNVVRSRRGGSPPEPGSGNIRVSRAFEPLVACDEFLRLGFETKRVVVIRDHGDYTLQGCLNVLGALWWCDRHATSPTAPLPSSILSLARFNAVA
jgi:hypothetical protein